MNEQANEGGTVLECEARSLYNVRLLEKQLGLCELARREALSLSRGL